MRYDLSVAHTVSGCLLAVLLAGDAAVGYESTLALRSVDEAIALGRSPIDATRVRYHQPYRLHVGRAPVDYIEIVTPFRRVELAAEERARAGNRLFGQREALAALADHLEQVDVVVEMTFHPLNTYVNVPAYDVAFTRAGSAASIDPVGIQRLPRFGARVEGVPYPYPVAPAIPSGSQPLLGGTLIGRFDARRLDPDGVYDVVVGDSGKELARARVNLGMLR